MKNHWAEFEYFSVAIFPNLKKYLKRRMKSVDSDGFEGQVSASESRVSAKNKAYTSPQPHPIRQSPLQSRADGVSLGGQ